MEVAAIEGREGLRLIPAHAIVAGALRLRLRLRLRLHVLHLGGLPCPSV